MKKKIFLIISILSLFLLVACQKKPEKAVVKSTPTIFLHGWGSSVNAEHQMTSAIKEAGVSNSVTQAIVDSSGKVTLVGSIAANAKNPLIEVGFKNNRNTDYHEDALWLKNVIIELQKNYKIKSIKLVGHSMGNMAIAYYLLENSNSNLPKLKKQVDIAGHFNGIIARGDKPNQVSLDSNGKPDHLDKNYKELLSLREKYPNKQVKVLNIFGDKNDGTHSDGSVTNASSQSLRYLLDSRPISYQEKKIKGENGQHSQLHENKEVDQILIHFLWP